MRWIWMVLGCALAAPASGQGVAVLDALVMTEASHPDLPLREVSGLVHDPASRRLLALSDRNDLFVLALDTGGDRIGLVLEGRLRLVGPNGDRLRRAQFSAEGVALAGGTLLAVSESPARLARFGLDGSFRGELVLPAALTDPTRLRTPRNGLESLAWHPDLGWLAAPETPLAGTPRRVHVLHGAQGPAVAWATGDEGPSTSLKAVETLPDGTLLVLERYRDATEAIVPLLRRIDPAACSPAAPCAAQAIPLELPTPPDADFEGLAWLGDGRVLIASDDRIDGAPRTVLVLLAMP
jgi:hypothetical protein